MAVFRIEKTKDYTVMANHHLKNRVLSLKAKGLISVMLSLPENWDFTLKGLACINKESIDAIREGIRELESAGYIIRTRSRNEKGQLAGAEYVIYELPQPMQSYPMLEKPTLDFPTQVNPTQENPILDNPTQLSTKVINTYPEIKHTSNIHPSNLDGMRIEHCRMEVRQRIDYYTFLDDPHESIEQLDEIVELIVEILCSAISTIRIAGNEHPAEIVKDRFRRLTDKHIGYVTSCLRQNTSKVRNIKKYLLAALFNAPVTVDHYYSAEYNHSYHGGGD
jgi:hypothetical protein